MAVMGKHGISANTPENILFGAGTFFKNLSHSTSGWTGDILGATSGGGKLSIVGELTDIEVDGALVKVEGLTVKTGGTATMEVNFAELTGDILQNVTLMKKETTSDVTDFIKLVDKPNIVAGDYIENLGFVGKTANGAKDLIVIFDKALCTSGFEIEPKNKTNSAFKGTFEAYAENTGDLDTLPVRVYYSE